MSTGFDVVDAHITWKDIESQVMTPTKAQPYDKRTICSSSEYFQLDYLIPYYCYI